MPEIFLEDFSGHSFPRKSGETNPATRSAKKSRSPKIKIREKSVLPKTENPFCQKPTLIFPLYSRVFAVEGFFVPSHHSHDNGGECFFLHSFAPFMRVIGIHSLQSHEYGQLKRGRQNWPIFEENLEGRGFIGGARSGTL